MPLSRCAITLDKSHLPGSSIHMNKFYILGFFVIVVGGSYWLFFHQTEKDRIKAPFRELEELVAEDTAPGLMGKARVVQTFRRIFQSQVVLETPSAPVSGVYTPEELAGVYLSMLGAGARIELRFRSLNIQSITDNRALVKARVEASVEEASGRTATHGAEVNVTLEKDGDGKWKLDHFREEGR